MFKMSKKIVLFGLVLMLMATFVACSEQVSEDAVTLYIMDIDTDVFNEKVVEIQDYDLGMLISAVEQELDMSIPLEYANIEGTFAIVSFVEGTGPLAMGSSGENVILESIAMTILRNMPEITEVYYRVGDDPYESGHYEFLLDEPYMIIE